jgi:deoxyinosine 3'endonuclease (endonuclease V)
VDGFGVLHPRGLGSASQLGVLAGLPTIGVAKNLLHVEGLPGERQVRAVVQAQQQAEQSQQEGGDEREKQQQQEVEEQEEEKGGRGVASQSAGAAVQHPQQELLQESRAAPASAGRAGDGSPQATEALPPPWPLHAELRRRSAPSASPAATPSRPPSSPPLPPPPQHSQQDKTVICNDPTLPIAAAAPAAAPAPAASVPAAAFSSSNPQPEPVLLCGEGGAVLGAAVCPPGCRRPIYVSVGHLIALGSALRIVLACCKYR